jgi:hypothetical protein
MPKQMRCAGCMLLICCVLLSGCSKTTEGIQGPAGPEGGPGQSITESRSAITGYVTLVSQFEVPQSVFDSVNVSTFMGDSLVKTVTDKTGKFSLPDLKAGTYRILFQRNGYDSIAVNVIHSAGNEDKFIGIIQMDGSLTTHILDQTLTVRNDPFVIGRQFLDMITTIDGPRLEISSRRYYSVYMYGKNVSFDYTYYTGSEGTNQFESQIFYSSSDINSTHFNPGDTVYVKTVLTPAYSLMTSWFDSKTYRDIDYPYNGDSTVNYFIWPN